MAGMPGHFRITARPLVPRYYTVELHLSEFKH
jgi:hypothetical protein